MRRVIDGPYGAGSSPIGRDKDRRQTVVADVADVADVVIRCCVSEMS
ncbi:hypothetical protein [Streptomyces sp. NPDC057617]